MSDKTTRGVLLAAMLSGSLSVAGLAQPAWAQDRELTPLIDRLDRLERDVSMLQRQVYRGGVAATAPGGAPAAAGPGDAQAALNDDLRISQVENQLRTVTGQIEQLNYNLGQLKQRLDQLASDVDVRFSQSGHGGAAAPATAAAASAAVPPPPGQPGTLGTLPAAPSGSAAQQASAAPPAATGVLPTGSAQEQYNYAFGLLRRADYSGAEQAFKAVIQQHPNTETAANAQYWLGETYFVRKDYTAAAAAYAEGYEKYPKSTKAPDNLLKLGMSLASLGRKTDACHAFQRLERDFPTAAANIKDREASEKQRLGC